jgi:hypothetical protein
MDGRLLSLPTTSWMMLTTPWMSEMTSFAPAAATAGLQPAMRCITDETALRKEPSSQGRRSSRGVNSPAGHSHGGGRGQHGGEGGQGGQGHVHAQRVRELLERHLQPSTATHPSE